MIISQMDSAYNIVNMDDAKKYEAKGCEQKNSTN